MCLSLNTQTLYARNSGGKVYAGSTLIWLVGSAIRIQIWHTQAVGNDECVCVFVVFWVSCVMLFVCLLLLSLSPCGFCFVFLINVLRGLCLSKAHSVAVVVDSECCSIVWCRPDSVNQNKVPFA